MSELIEYLKVCPYKLEFKLSLEVDGKRLDFGTSGPVVTLKISSNDLEAVLRSKTTLSALREEGRIECSGDSSLVLIVHRFFSGITLPNNPA